MQLSGASPKIQIVVVIVVVVTVVTLHRHPFSASSECWWFDGQYKKPSSFGGRGHQLLFCLSWYHHHLPRAVCSLYKADLSRGLSRFSLCWLARVKPSRVNGRDPEGTATAPDLSFLTGGSLPGSGVSLSRTNCDACSHGIALCVLGLLLNISHSSPVYD